METENRMYRWLDRAFDWYRHRIPESVQVALPLAPFAIFAFIAFGLGHSSLDFRWALLASVLAYLGTFYLTAAWVASTALAGNRLRLIGLQKTKSDLRKIHWSQFERLVEEVYREQGYVVESRGGPKPDGGVDSILRRDGSAWLVQCKHWPNETFFVGVKDVRALLGVVTKEGSSGGRLVTSGIFSETARAFAVGTTIELVDGDELWRMLEEAQVDPRHVSNGSVAAPRCGFCHSWMVEREESTVSVCQNAECGARVPIKKPGWLAT